MFEGISRRFADIIKSVGGQTRMTPANIEDALQKARLALLEADVALPVAREFVARVKDRALGETVQKSITPGQAFVRLAHRELTRAMGEADAPLNLRGNPAVILACGLQGVGKTTNLAKIAKRLQQKHKKRVFLVGADDRRAAAFEQLQTLAEKIKSPCIKAPAGDAQALAAAVLPQARQVLADVVLVDTAGRTAIDDEMMAQIRAFAAALQPSEILFFIDAMQGQDAVNTARAFAAALPVTGLVLTKLDGDSRGGAALSARRAVGCPIKFAGVGEGLDDLQPFHPERMASRILGMGDMQTLIEEAADKVDARAGKTLLRKMGKGKKGGFDFDDYLAQMRQINKMGGLRALADKMPGQIAQKITASGIDDSHFKRLEAAILSMTPGERKAPEIIKASRKRRIAAGSGVDVPQINTLIKNLEQAQKMFRRFGKAPKSAMRAMSGLMS